MNDKIKEMLYVSNWHLFLNRLLPYKIFVNVNLFIRSFVERLVFHSNSDIIIK